MKLDISPQEGFQKEALSTNADIAIIGGAAGGGKTAVLLMDAMRWHFVPEYGAIIFRRTYTEITQQDGVWDQSSKFYPQLGGKANETKLKWTFPSGARISFSHLQHEKDLRSHQGAQYAFIGFDELTHFSRKEFVYLLSRNRSVSGVDPIIRASCNPDPDSWVAEFIDWFINPATGFPNRERCGKLRYFTSDNDTFVWGDSREEVIEKCPHIFNDEKVKESGVDPKELIRSMTFIPGTIYENRILMEKDPRYLGNLMALGEEEKSQLLDGNWKMSTGAKDLFYLFKIEDCFNAMVKDNDDKFYITCDHARFGRDLCVVITWRGWRAIRIDIIAESDSHDIVKIIMNARTIYRPIPSSQIIVDQDGIGVKDLIGCHVFQGAGSAHRLDTDLVVDYENKRTQCYYVLADKVDKSELSISLTDIYLWTKKPNQLLAPTLINQIKIGSKTDFVKEFIKNDLRTVRRYKSDEGNRKRITPKKQQKNVLNGRSPDFGDALAMRSEFEFIRQPTYIRKK
jgi:Terminase large subunit, T4likevirus-type, N-terminal